VTVGHGAVWTIDPLASSVTRLDPDSMRTVSIIPITGGVDAIASGDEHVWVLTRGVGSLTQIDVNTNRRRRPSVSATRRPRWPPASEPSGWATRTGSSGGWTRPLEITKIPVGVQINALAVDEDAETLWIDLA
jgi:hypothetical protein